MSRSRSPSESSTGESSSSVAASSSLTDEEMPSEPSRPPVEQEDDHEEVVCLLSMENEKIYVNRKTLAKAEMIIEMWEKIGEGEDNQVPLNFSTETIQKIATWLEKRYNRNLTKALKMEPDAPTPLLPAWDHGFFSEMQPHVLAEILEASLFLHITELYTMACRHTASLIRGKSVEEIRKILDITDDFDAKEKKYFKKHSAWCTEP